MSDETTTTTTYDERVDGRTARRDRNKQAVLDAVIDLFSEGNLSPGVHEVAERSGVSLRSVYRYFADADDLVAAAIEQRIAQAEHLFDMPDPGVGPTTSRIDRFCQRRIQLFSFVRSVYRASAVRAADRARHATDIEAARIALAKQTAEMFAPELDELPVERAAVVSGILDTLSQFDALELIWRNHGHQADAATEFLSDAFAEVLLEPSST